MRPPHGLGVPSTNQRRPRRTMHTPFRATCPKTKRLRMLWLVQSKSSTKRTIEIIDETFNRNRLCLVLTERRQPPLAPQTKINARFLSFYSLHINKEDNAVKLWQHIMVAVAVLMLLLLLLTSPLLYSTYHVLIDNIYLLRSKWEVKNKSTPPNVLCVREQTFIQHNTIYTWRQYEKENLQTNTITSSTNYIIINNTHTCNL